jgi:ubiquitin C-terminal hydrolase
MSDLKKFYQNKEYEEYGLCTEPLTIRNILKFDIKQLRAILENIKNSKDETKNNKYDLIAVINHSGKANSGHYYSYVKVNREWIRFDDARVCVVTEQEVMDISQGRIASESNCYCLFYEKSIF